MKKTTWLKNNWFPLSVAVWQGLASISGVATDWLALGEGWQILRAVHDLLRVGHVVE